MNHNDDNNRRGCLCVCVCVCVKSKGGGGWRVGEATGGRNRLSGATCNRKTALEPHWNRSGTAVGPQTATASPEKAPQFEIATKLH